MLIGAPSGMRNGTHLSMTFKRRLAALKDAGMTTIVKLKLFDIVFFFFVGRTLSYEHPLFIMVSHCDHKDFTFGIITIIVVFDGC
jgi:hypothetical protein